MVLLVGLVAVALIFDFMNGRNDAANSIATIVSTRVLSPRYAVAWAAFFNFIAFLIFGLHVASTIGTGIIQAITINESDFEGYRSTPDFIQRYIFPGGMLMTKTAMREQAKRVGLILENVENFRLSYARTLALWRERFLERWHEIQKLGFDETFKRKWVYYLSYCEAGFAEGSIDVGIYQYRKPA